MTQNQAVRSQRERLVARPDVTALAIVVFAASASAMAAGADLRLGWVVVAALVILGLFNYRLVPRRLAGMTIAMTAAALVLLFFSPSPFLDIANGFKIGGVFVSLMASVSLLVAVARRSALVQGISDILFAAPLRAPNSWLTVVGQLFPALLNIGGSALLCEMAALKRDTAQPRHDRATMAIYLPIHRGFLAASCWSPIFGQLALLLLLYPGLEWTHVAPYGFVIGVLCALVSLAVGPSLPAHADGPRAGLTSSTTIARAIAPLVALMLIFLGTSLALHAVSGIPVAIAIVIQTPAYAFVSHMALSGGLIPAAGQFLGDARQVLPRLVPEALFFAAGGCVTTLLGASIPHEVLIEISNVFADGTARAIAFVMILSIILALVGLHPFLTSLMIASALPPAVLGLSPLLHFLTVLLSCAIAFGTSPYTILSIMVSRYLDISPFRIVFGRNTLFLLATAIAGGVLLWGWSRIPAL